MRKFAMPIVVMFLAFSSGTSFADDAVQTFEELANETLDTDFAQDVYNTQQISDLFDISFSEAARVVDEGNKQEKIEKLNEQQRKKAKGQDYPTAG